MGGLGVIHLNELLHGIKDMSGDLMLKWQYRRAEPFVMIDYMNVIRSTLMLNLYCHVALCE